MITRKPYPFSLASNRSPPQVNTRQPDLAEVLKWLS
jgi:hypothetical protein